MSQGERKRRPLAARVTRVLLSGSASDLESEHAVTVAPRILDARLLFTCDNIPYITWVAPYWYAMIDIKISDAWRLFL